MYELEAGHPLVGNMRGLGLLLGMALVKDAGKRTPATDEADRVMYECFARGLSFKVSGGNFLTLTPPLTIREEEMNHAVRILDESLSVVEN